MTIQSDSNSENETEIKTTDEKIDEQISIFKIITFVLIGIVLMVPIIMWLVCKFCGNNKLFSVFTPFKTPDLDKLKAHIDKRLERHLLTEAYANKTINGRPPVQIDEVLIALSPAQTPRTRTLTKC